MLSVEVASLGRRHRCFSRRDSTLDPHLASRNAPRHRADDLPSVCVTECAGGRGATRSGLVVARGHNTRLLVAMPDSILYNAKTCSRPDTCGRRLTMLTIRSE